MAGMTKAMRAVVDVVANPESIYALGKALADSIKYHISRGAMDAVTEVTDDIDQVTDAHRKAAGVKRGVTKAQKDAEDAISGADKADEEHKAKVLSTLQTANRITQAGANFIQSTMKTAMGILEDIYNRLKAASPLLQTIESLFQLAMTLFFMPLGTKIAELMIPAVIKLLDSVVGIWDKFEGKTLGGIMSEMIHEGAQIFSRFFYDIAEALIEQGGWLGKIGQFLQAIGSFIENGLIGTVTLILSFTTFMVSHLKEFIALFIGFTVAHVALMMALIIASGSHTPWGAAIAVGAGAVAGVIAYGALGAMGMAEGGYVPAKEGGSLRILGEGGQGEYVIPEDRINNLGGTTTITYNISGVTSDELGRMIEERVDRQISGSRYRSGF